MQAGALFADLRVPLARPDLAGRSCLADLTHAELTQLMTAEGFAGHITVQESRCTWHRAINWHGVPEANDIGVMYFAQDALIEDGVLADYRERWMQVPTQHLSGSNITVGDQSGVMIESETSFLIGLGPVPSGTSADLISALNGGTGVPEGHFASTYCLGTWDGNDGVADLCTNPFCEGTVVLTRGAQSHWHGPSFTGQAAATLITAT